MMARARPICWAPKKTGDHRKFSATSDLAYRVPYYTSYHYRVRTAVKNVCCQSASKNLHSELQREGWTCWTNPAAGQVLADRVQIQQVLVNLMRNAMEAMEESERRELVVKTARAESDMIAVTVSDTGGGIAEDLRPQLFQPFFTTKKHGMGIGLSISRSIIEAHGGEIRADPNPGGGTVFRLTLPAVSHEGARDDG
jgi:C4-dicarboxylate-specific signal transduction histidine kinase